MTDIMLAVHRAVLELAKAALGPSVPVYDWTPASAPYPRVIMEMHTATPDEDLEDEGPSGYDHRLTLTAWSQKGGAPEVIFITGRIAAQLAETNLALETGRVVFARTVQRQAVRDADGVTYMGSIELQISTQTED